MLDEDLIRSLTGEYEQVAKSAAATNPSPLIPIIQKASNPDAWHDAVDWGAPVEKALVISVTGTEVASASNARPSVEAEQNFFLGAGALIPRYDPWAMARVWENSSALRPCIDSYAANIDGYGFRLEPVIDIEKEGAHDLVKSALLQQRIYEGSSDPVTEDHIQATIETMRLEMQREKFKLERFYAYCCPTTSFVEMRMQSRLELEALGNAYWEVIRDGNRQIQQFVRIDGVTMRLRPIHIEHVLVDTPQKMSPLTYTTIPVPRRFRTFVQLVNGMIAVYFKEFGDQRTLSAKTGNFYESVEELKVKEGEMAVEATEILWWSIFSPIGPYGVPRWVGATMNVLGLRASEEINFSYFDKKCIPHMAILVSGGSLKEGAADAIKNHLKETIQGRENFWSILVVEAESAPGAMGPGSRVKLELRPLADAQMKDALFQEYEKNGQAKIGSQFRLPELLRGVSQEVNRAQSEAVLQFTEQQVFEPIRESFDNVMNRRVFADMGIRYWQFKTNSAPASDPEQLVELSTQLATGGALTVNETRELASEALNKEFKKIEAPWGDVPFQLTLQKVLDPETGKAPAPPAGPPGMPGDPNAPPGTPGAEGDPAAAAAGGKPGAPPFGGKGKPGSSPFPAKGEAPKPGAPTAPGAEAEPPTADKPGADPALQEYFKARADVARKPITITVPMAKLLEWVTPSDEEAPT